MREIKFRAWDKKEKKIITKGLLLSPQQGLRIFDFPDFYVEFAEDNRYVLMQYTGLKDKNGVEIYEGDIVKVNYSTRVVEWLEPFAGFILRFTVEEIKDSWEAFDEWHKSDLEVIGNIYENPELLQG